MFANFVEWCVHGGPMHHPSPWLMELYRHHATEHHVVFTHEEMEFQDSRELKLVLFEPLFFPFLLAVTSPIPIVLSLLVSPNLGWLYLISTVLYYLVYEWFHTVHHWPRESRIGRSWFARLIRRHHTRHHDPRRMATGNFNVSFPLADYLLGTTLPKLSGDERGGARVPCNPAEVYCWYGETLACPADLESPGHLCRVPATARGWKSL